MGRRAAGDGDDDFFLCFFGGSPETFKESTFSPASEKINEGAAEETPEEVDEDEDDGDWLSEEPADFT